LFKSWDGVELFYRRWEPLPPSGATASPSTGPKRALIALVDDPAGSECVQELADGLALDDFWIFSYDARGQGRSPGPRGYARDFGELVRDLDYFCRTITSNHAIPIEEISIVASHCSAVRAIAWVHDFAPRIRSLILASPALELKYRLPLTIPALRLAERLWGQFSVNGLAPGGEIASQILIGMQDASSRLIASAGSVVTPTLLIAWIKDPIARLAPQRRFFERLGASARRIEMFQSKERARTFSIMRDFILGAHGSPVDRDFLRSADREGPSQRRFAELSRRAGLLDRLVHRLRSMWHAMLARFSTTARIGLESGFDSGLLADHEYRNNPSGKGLPGKYLDRLALSAQGSRALRVRKAYLEKAIETAIRSLHAAGEPARIVDLAGGPGRYLLEIANRHRDKRLSILIRDHVPANLAQGRRHASELSLLNVRFEEADAFLDPILPVVPNVVVLSGLLELYSSNAMAARAIEAAARALQDGGYVIYTGQPWQPRQEKHPRVRLDRDGKPGVLRTRSQAELDELFRAYGFEKIWTEADPNGLNTVSLASKKAQALPAADVAGQDLSGTWDSEEAHH
jgi:SAM-dependent methyltransferase